MQVLYWVIGLVCAAAGAAVVTWLIMRSRQATALAMERQALAEARGALEGQRQAIEEKLRSVEDAARRRALDEFLADMRVEERHYVREHKLLFMSRKSLVVQERVYFRNIPLSNWIEQERVLEEGADIEKMVKSISLFDSSYLPGTEAERKRLPR